MMLRLMFYTAVRVSALCNIQVQDVDLEGYKIRINQGKGSKDRYVLFGKSFATALRTHIAAHAKNRWLFQTSRATKFSTRRVQQIVKLYAEQAGVKATPHTFRHQAITWLTRNSGLADADLQLITGHARRETLAVYQHIALDGDLEAKYHETMKGVDLLTSVFDRRFLDSHTGHPSSRMGGLSRIPDLERLSKWPRRGGQSHFAPKAPQNRDSPRPFC